MWIEQDRTAPSHQTGSYNLNDVPVNLVSGARYHFQKLSTHRSRSDQVRLSCVTSNHVDPTPKWSKEVTVPEARLRLQWVLSECVFVGPNMNQPFIWQLRAWSCRHSSFHLGRSRRALTTWIHSLQMAPVSSCETSAQSSRKVRTFSGKLA